MFICKKKSENLEIEQLQVSEVRTPLQSHKKSHTVHTMYSLIQIFNTKMTKER